MIGLILALSLSSTPIQTSLLALEVGETGTGADPTIKTDAPKPKPKPKKKPKPKPDPASVAPTGPVPYESLKAAGAPPAVTTGAQPAKDMSAAKPDTASPQPSMAHPLSPEPVPSVPKDTSAPAPMAQPMPRQMPRPAEKPFEREINLRCETVVNFGGGHATRGIFYISLMPSEMTPDEHADFRIMSIDPKHESLVRDTDCFSYQCPTIVSPVYYDLARPNGRNYDLRITINRQTGAYSARRRKATLVIPHIEASADEQGWCSKVAAKDVLF